MRWRHALAQGSRGLVLIAGAGVAGLLGLTGTAAAAPFAGGHPAAAGTPAAAQLPSTTPASGTPAFPTVTSRVEQVRQLVQCGGTMYAVGSFSVVGQGGSTFHRANAFSFRATAPYTMTSWNPRANGQVNTLAFNGPNCSQAYLGGRFSSVHGTRAQNIAEVSTSTGAVITRFERAANHTVYTLVANRGHLLAGGLFTTINGSSNRHLTSLNPVTGHDDGFVRLGISGHYGGTGTTKIYNQQVSHNGALDLLEGTFTRAGGQARQQIFMIRLTGPTAVVTRWTSAEFNRGCAAREQFYVRAASWAPGDGTIYLADTGYRPPKGANTGLCDAAAAFPARQRRVRYKWVNYTGCDSLYSTVAGADTAFFGGHERWASNSRACDVQGPGAVRAPGMVGLSAARGSVTFNPTRGRGLGADDMLLTPAGLWVASDNFDGTSTCGGVTGHAGLCFLPYRRA
jgi:hypothetical protein